MLTILNELGKYRDEETGTFDLDAFKIIYVAPMKALVQEMVGNFSSRLGVFGIKVGELTGDSQMTKQQIAETQIIVTTPEKYDVITRKSNDTSYTNLVRLIIIDEIQLAFHYVERDFGQRLIVFPSIDTDSRGIDGSCGNGRPSTT